MVVGGVASGTYLSPAAGTHSITASYGGDADFNASSSQAVTTSVSAMPDFTLAASGSMTQTVAPGDVANYSMTVAAQSGAFTGAVDLNASGLPAGATVSFSPPQVVPGAGSAAVTMSVQTNATLARRQMEQRNWGVVFACFILPWLLMGRCKRGLRGSFAICSMMALLVGAVGCGARSIATVPLVGQTYTLTVTGTSTNLAGAVVSHSINVTLVVQ
jgi:hypothetical protein